MSKSNLNNLIMYIIGVLIQYKKKNVILNTRFVSEKYRNKKHPKRSPSFFKLRRIAKKREAIKLYKTTLQKWVNRVIDFIIKWLKRIANPSLRIKINKAHKNAFNAFKTNPKKKVEKVSFNKFKNWNVKNKFKSNKFSKPADCYQSRNTRGYKHRRGHGRGYHRPNHRRRKWNRNKRFINLKIPILSNKDKKILRSIYKDYIIPLKNKDLQNINTVANIYQKSLNWLKANKSKLSITYDFLYLLVQAAYLCADQLKNYNRLKNDYDVLFTKYENLKAKLNLRLQGSGSVTASKTVVLQYANKQVC